MLFSLKFKIIFKIAALLLLALTVAFLFIPFTASVKTSMIASEYMYGSGKTLSSETDYREVNYFDYTDAHGEAMEYIFIAVLVLCIAVIIASFFVKFLDKVFFAALPLIAIVLYIIVLDGADVNHVLSSGRPVNIGGLYVRTEKTIRYSLSIAPIILLALATITQAAYGALDIVKKIKEKNAATASMNNEDASAEQADDNAQAQQNERFDDLKKYKELLDQGIITQEDFDEKKKQFLGL